MTGMPCQAKETASAATMLSHFFFVRLADAQVGFFHGDVHIRADGDQVLAHTEMGQGFAESGLLLGGEFIQMSLDPFE